MIRRPPRSTLFPLHDALPIFRRRTMLPPMRPRPTIPISIWPSPLAIPSPPRGEGIAKGEGQMEMGMVGLRSEEHTSELQSHLNLVCRLLLEKKKIPPANHTRT